MRINCSADWLARGDGFEATRRDHYDGLRAVTERSAWEDWLLYFLNGVARQSEDALSRAERINQQLNQARERVNRTGSGVAPRLLDLLSTNPFITVRKAEAQLEVAYNTAAAAEILVRPESLDDRTRTVELLFRNFQTLLFDRSATLCILILSVALAGSAVWS